MTKSLTSRQFAILLGISILGFKLTFFPSMLYKYANVDGFFSALILLIFDLISFLLLFHVFIKNKDISFSDFLESRLGKFLPKIIYLTLFAFFLFKLLVLSSGGFYFARESLFEGSNLLLFILVLFVTINSLFLFKLKSFGRTTEMLFPVILLAIATCVILGLLTAKNYGITPILQTKPDNILYSSFNAYFCSGDFLFLLIFMGKVDVSNKINKHVVRVLSIIYLLLIAFFYTYFSIYRYTAFLHQHAITDIVKFVPISAIIENLDWFPTSLMLTQYIFLGTLYLFCMVNMLKILFHFKNKRYDSRWLLIPINLITIILIYILFSNFDLLIKILQNHLNIFGIITVWSITLFVFFLSFVNKKVEIKNQMLVKISNENLKWVSLENLKKMNFKKKSLGAI